MHIDTGRAAAGRNAGRIIEVKVAFVDITVVGQLQGWCGLGEILVTVQVYAERIVVEPGVADLHDTAARAEGAEVGLEVPVADAIDTFFDQRIIGDRGFAHTDILLAYGFIADGINTFPAVVAGRAGKRGAVDDQPAACRGQRGGIIGQHFDIDTR